MFMHFSWQLSKSFRSHLVLCGKPRGGRGKIGCGRRMDLVNNVTHIEIDQNPFQPGNLVSTEAIGYVIEV